MNEAVHDDITHAAIPDKGRKRNSWRMWAILVCGLFLILIAIMMPFFQQQLLFRQLENQGARLIVNDRQMTGLSEISYWLEQQTGLETSFLKQVISADFAEYPATDETLEVAGQWPELGSIGFRNDHITPAGLKEFLSRANNLKRLVIVSCPAINPDCIEEIQTKYPALEVNYRGTSFLGIQGSNIPAGCLVQLVVTGSAAQQAGLKPGDVIIGVNGVLISGFDELVGQLAMHAPGDTVNLRLMGRDELDTIAVELGHWPDL